MRIIYLDKTKNILFLMIVSLFKEKIYTNDIIILNFILSLDVHNGIILKKKLLLYLLLLGNQKTLKIFNLNNINSIK